MVEKVFLSEDRERFFVNICGNIAAGEVIKMEWNQRAYILRWDLQVSLIVFCYMRVVTFNTKKLVNRRCD